MTYDIVIVTYNSARWLPGCLKALSSLRYSLAKLNLIFVDNCSTDDTLTVLDSLKEDSSFGGFVILPQALNGGFAKGCNTGAKSGTAPYLFFLNADTEVDPEILNQLDKGIIAAEKQDTAIAAFECRQIPFETGHHIDPVTLLTSWASGAALVVKRSAFQQIKGFDENLFMYCEDVDLSWRLRGAGYKIQYLPGAKVTHYSYQGEATPQIKLSEYAGSFYGNLLLRYKFGRPKEIWEGHKMYLGALKQPLHFDNVRKVLAKNYLKHFTKLWPFLFWRGKNKQIYQAKPAQFEGGFSPDRGLCRLKPLTRQPLVSVVVRTCGRPDTLRNTLQSLNHQTYQNFEVVVVEDGPPVSQQMIEGEFPALNIRYFSTGQKNGRAKAGNRGLAEAKGEYLNFLDDDDFFYPDHLELMVSYATAHPEVDFITGSSMAMEADVISTAPYEVATKAIYPMVFHRMDNFMLCQSCLMPIQSILFKKSLYEKAGGLNETLEGDEDWSMWLKYFATGKRLNQDRVDISRATSVFLVPADPQAAKKRLEGYKIYEDAMLDDPTITFTVTPRQMRQYYQGVIGDMQHLAALGKLEEFLAEQKKDSE